MCVARARRTLNWGTYVASIVPHEEKKRQVRAARAARGTMSAGAICPQLWKAVSQGLPLPDNWSVMPLSSRLLDVAVWNDHGETVAQLLTNQCADMLVPRWHGRTVLQYAAWRGSCRAAAALLQAKAEVDRISRDGWGPALLHAASNCDLDMIRVLLEGKADVQLAGDGRVTPLMAAAEKKDTALVQLLIDAKADVNAYDEDCCSVLWYAAAEGRAAVVQVLLEARVDGRGKGTWPPLQSPLHVAAEYGYSDVVALLQKSIVGPGP